MEETTTHKANFTRSRYSKYRQRTTTTTTTLSPISNESTVLSETVAPVIITLKRRKTTTNVPTTIQTTEQITTTSTTTTPATTITTPLTTTEAPKTTIKPNNETKCGERIGENVPWIAILEHSNPTGNSKKKSLSKGVLIDSQHVITTISSIHNSNPFWVVSGIRLGDLPTWGENSTTKGSKSDVVRVGVSAVYLHKRKDLAIIKLDRKINSTSKFNQLIKSINWLK